MRLHEHDIKAAGKERGAISAEDIAKQTDIQSKEVNKLVTNMRTHTAEMRAKMADAEEIYLHIGQHESKLGAAMGDSQDVASALHTFNEEMEGDFKLMKEKPLWSKAVGAFLSAALGENSAVEVTTPGLSVFLAECLAMAAPDVKPVGTAVVGLHPENKEMLKVFFASDKAELQMGATMKELKDNSSAIVSAMVWRVLKTGVPELNNAHGIARDRGERSVCPLKSTKGNTFGVLVTGPPPVPDELVEMMCRQAGPLLERVWKLERVRLAIRNVVSFIKRYTLENSQLVFAEFAERARMQRYKADDTWHWMPLTHNPHDPDKFELELKWRLGEPVGVLTVSCGTFTKMDEHLVVLLHVMGDVLINAVDEIEDLTPGDPSPLATVTSVLDEYERNRHLVPVVLQKEVMQQLQVFDGFKVFGELCHFEGKAIDKETFSMMQGLLCLLGWNRKNIKDWDAAKKIFRNSRKLHDAMLEMAQTEPEPGSKAEAQGIKGIPAAALEKRWAEYNICVRGIDLRALSDRSPASIQLILRWLDVMKMEHSIEGAIAEEAKPPPADPIADKIFDDIDTNKNGFLEASELTAYLLKEFPTKVAHTLLRVLDSDMDKKVSRDEWRRGWADGLLTSLLLAEHKKDQEENKREEGARMRAKRGSNVMGLTVAAAAAEFNAKHAAEAAAGGGKKKAAAKPAAAKPAGKKK